MSTESQWPHSVLWCRDKAKWLVVPLSIILPLSYFYSIDRYVRIQSYYIVDTTPPMVHGIVVGCFYLTLLLGLLTIPRWYSWVAIASIATFIMVGMTCYP